MTFFLGLEEGDPHSWRYEDVVCSVLNVEVTNAEHTEANLLPCNAAARLQARAECEEVMSPLAEFDRRLERIIREFALRIVVPRWTEFDTVWEAAIRVCDRYELGKGRRSNLVVNDGDIQNSYRINSSPQGSQGTTEE